MSSSSSDLGEKRYSVINSIGEVVKVRRVSRRPPPPTPPETWESREDGVWSYRGVLEAGFDKYIPLKYYVAREDYLKSWEDKERFRAIRTTTDPNPSFPYVARSWWPRDASSRNALTRLAERGHDAHPTRLHDVSDKKGTHKIGLSFGQAFFCYKCVELFPLVYGECLPPDLEKECKPNPMRAHINHSKPVVPWSIPMASWQPPTPEQIHGIEHFFTDMETSWQDNDPLIRARVARMSRDLGHDLCPAVLREELLALPKVPGTSEPRIIQRTRDVQENEVLRVRSKAVGCLYYCHQCMRLHDLTHYGEDWFNVCRGIRKYT
jgi:hypothetical protein